MSPLVLLGAWYMAFAFVVSHSPLSGEAWPAVIFLSGLSCVMAKLLQQRQWLRSASCGAVTLVASARALGFLASEGAMQPRLAGFLVWGLVAALQVAAWPSFLPLPKGCRDGS